jgi:hypothetical protein
MPDDQRGLNGGIEARLHRGPCRIGSVMVRDRHPKIPDQQAAAFEVLNVYPSVHDSALLLHLLVTERSMSALRGRNRQLEDLLVSNDCTQVDFSRRFTDSST